MDAMTAQSGFRFVFFMRLLPLFDFKLVSYASGLTAIVQQQAQFQSGIYKPLPTGGVAGITFTAPYTFTNLPARINPNYQPSVQFTLEQPLLQGFGVEINQLRAFHPGSIIPFSPPNSLTQAPAVTYLPYNFNNTSGVGLGLPPGILIARVRFNQNRAEFERNVNQMLLNVEDAYWNLYGSYWQLYSREQGLRFAYRAWRDYARKFNVGAANLAEIARAEGQYNQFRSQRLQAIDTVLDNERQLRAMLGMQTEDGTRLVPSDAPIVVEKRPDWDKALTETLKRRPEMRLARQDVKSAEKNSLEQRRALLVLQDQELKAERFLGLYYRRMSSAYFQIKAARDQRERFTTQLKRSAETYHVDSSTPGDKLAALEYLLDAQRSWADALATEYQAIVTYNNALAGWEYAKGASMAYAHVRFTEDTASDDEEVRAVEQERDRTREKVRREKAAPVDWYLTASKTDDHAVRQQPMTAFSLPSLWKTIQPLKEAEELPPVREGIDVDKWLGDLPPLK